MNNEGVDMYEIGGSILAWCLLFAAAYGWMVAI